MPKHPGNLPQGRLLAVLEGIHPDGVLLALDADGDAAGAGDDVVGVLGVGDGPVGPGVAADGAEARAGVEELEAGLDPLARVGRVGEEQEEAGLVELVGVGGGECEGCGGECLEGAGGVGAVWRWRVLA